MKKYVLLFCFLVGFAVKAKELSFFYSHLPPYEYTEQNGQASGIGINKVNQLFNKFGIRINYEFSSSLRGVKQLHSGEIDFSSAINPNQSLSEQFWVSKKPIYYIDLVAYRKPFQKPINELVQLKSLPYAYLNGVTFYYLDEHIRPNLNANNHIGVDSHQEGIKLIMNNKLPYYLSYDLPELKGLWGDNLAVDRIAHYPVHLIISKQNPNLVSLSQTINKIMAN